jgi:uncharacterized protein (DUF433 family)
MKLKEEYKNKKISYNGITYDFKNLNEEKLEKIWTYNKDLRFLFEEKVEPVKFDPIVEKLSEEEFFNETIKDYLNTPKKPIKLPTKLPKKK